MINIKTAWPTEIASFGSSDRLNKILLSVSLELDFSNQRDAWEEGEGA